MGYIEGLLAKNETIAFRSRQHWFVLARSLAFNFFVGVILIVVALFIASLSFVRARGDALVTLVLIGVALWPVGMSVYQILKWRNREFFVTNRRVIQSRGILSKRVIDSSLDKVNDVVLAQSFLGRMLDYGNIEILTASEIGVNLIRSIAEPIKFKMTMMEQKERMRGGGGYDDPNSLLDELEELHRSGVLTDAEYIEKKRQLGTRR